MAFDFIIPIIGNDLNSTYRAPYMPQIPLLLYIKYSLSTTIDTPYLRWTLYWYEYVDGQLLPQRKQKRYDRLNLGEGARSWTGYVELLESEMNLNRYSNAVVQPKDFRLLIELFDAPLSTQVLESAEYNFNVGGRHKYAVNWNMPQIVPYSNVEYPTTGEDNQIVVHLSSYNSRDSGTPLFWREEYDKISAGGWYKLMLIVVNQFDNEPIDLDVAIERGYIPSSWRDVLNSATIDSENYFPPFRYDFGYQLDGGFLRKGDYKLVIAFYEKNDTEIPGYYTLRTIESSQFRIYELFAGAAFHISNVVPAVYKEGDTNPLNGMPPFTVTIADDTDRSQYIVPLDYITIDWDDIQSESGVWTVTNPGTSAITIPPHIYNDSKTHVIRMTCRDKRGTTHTKEVAFAPSQEPRIISRPKLNNSNPGTTLNMSYPALMQGTAFNAGTPAPETTWAYALQNDPGYYSGNKMGDYAEFSLLAQGRYTVTATVRNGEIVLNTYTWTVNVGAEPVSTDADSEMEEYALIVLDNNSSPVDYCKQHSCPQYSENFQSLDTVSFELPADYQYAKYLKEGYWFLFGHGGKARLMQVTYRSKKNGILTVSAESAFPKRVAVFATRSTADGGYDVQKCSAEALVRYFVYTSTADDPYTHTPRGANIMMHGTNQDLPAGGEQVTYSARYDNTLDIINSICKTAGIGYEIAVRNYSSLVTYIQMHILEGTNRTYSSGGSGAVIFSENLKNCVVESEQNALAPNIAVVAGEGVGNYRQHSYYDKNGNLNPSSTGYNRRELFVDAGDSADTAEQKRMAMYQLREEQVYSISLQVLPSCQWKFGTDYHVGDTVSVWLDSRGGLVDLQIYSADCVLRESGEELHLHLGSRVQTAPALIASNERKNTYARK